MLHFCNQDGSDKRKPMVIGRAKRPRAFKKIPTEQLPVLWEFNRKAWMTRVIFEPFLRKFDREMRLQKRKVILFMDNASSHKIENLNLTNVNLLLFPPNVTSQIQPLDLGIIRAFKARFKKKLLQPILSNMLAASTPGDLLKNVTILHAVYWVAESWEETKPETIQRCFRKAGFVPYVANGQDAVEGEEAEVEEAQESLENEEDEDDEA